MASTSVDLPISLGPYRTLRPCSKETSAERIPAKCRTEICLIHIARSLSDWRVSGNPTDSVR